MDFSISLVKDSSPLGYSVTDIFIIDKLSRLKKLNSKTLRSWPQRHLMQELMCLLVHFRSINGIFWIPCEVARKGGAILLAPLNLPLHYGLDIYLLLSSVLWAAGAWSSIGGFQKKCIVILEQNGDIIITSMKYPILTKDSYVCSVDWLLIILPWLFRDFISQYIIKKALTCLDVYQRPYFSSLIPTITHNKVTYWGICQLASYQSNYPVWWIMNC